MTPRQRTAALACALWLACGLYTSEFVFRGWVPHDEGTIGQDAERVLGGEVPHRDFDDLYTSGLTYLNAAAMRIGGVSLRAPRLALYVFFLLFLAAVYDVASRVASPRAGLVAMVVVTAWSVPNYFVSLPSWYNLFFATFGASMLLRFLDTRRARWLWIAGALGGVSILFKISGIFFLAGGVLFLIYVEQMERPAVAGRRSRFWPVVALPGAISLAGLADLLLTHAVAPASLHLFAPALAVCLFVPWHDWARAGGSVGDRARRLTRLLVPLAAGAAVPLLFLALFYWRQHAIADLFRGVFVLPQRRMIDPVEAEMRPPDVTTLGLALPYVFLLLSGRTRAMRGETVFATGLAVFLGAVLIMSSHVLAYQTAWAVFRSLTLVATGVGLWLVAEPTLARSPDRRARVFLLVALAATVSLIQFPFAAPIYFCYAAPVTALALVAIVAAQPFAPTRLHVVVAAFSAVFAIAFMNRTYVWTLGFEPVPYQTGGRLDVDRGGLDVPAEDKATYEALVQTLGAVVHDGTIFAGPDCPEVYFLAGFPNPTRAVFDFLSPVREDGPWMTDLLDRVPIRAVVVNTRPLFSPPLNADVLATIDRRFPGSRRIGQFDVRFPLPASAGPLGLPQARPQAAD